jgi:hypothetical protein
VRLKGAMKVKVKITKTDKGLQACVIQDGRHGSNLITRRTNSLDVAKTQIIVKLKGCEVDFELEGVEK